MADRLDVIAAFADGEPVAALELEAALAHEDARAYLIDVLALRGLVDARPQASGAGTVRRTSQHAGGRGRWLAGMAALVIAGVAGGYSAGRHAGSPSNVTNDGAAVVQSASAPAPAPTHVFRMENGVNWNERAGGN